MTLISANKKMKSILNNINFNFKKLPRKLENLIDLGFTYENGCVFLSGLYIMDRNSSESEFPDKTGYECFVNSLHIDDYVDNDFLIFSLFFVDKLFSFWHTFDNRSIRAIVSCDEFGAVVRFHLLRENEIWLNENIEASIQPILYIDSPNSTEKAISLL